MAVAQTELVAVYAEARRPTWWDDDVLYAIEHEGLVCRSVNFSLYE